MELFLTVFSFVPEDKLHWTPAPSAKSGLQIAAHTAVTAGNFASMLRDRKLPSDVPAHLARTQAAEDAVTNRAEMEALYRRNTQAVLEALDELSAEDIAMPLDSSQGWSMPMTFLMQLAGIHAYTHVGQIDYLQTCWGDLEVHF